MPASPSPFRRPAVPRRFRGEVDLYEPVKRFLEDLGYEAKGGVRGCDVVAVRPGGGGPADPPVVVELKLAFTLGSSRRKRAGGMPRQSGMINPASARRRPSRRAA